MITTVLIDLYSREIDKLKSSFYCRYWETEIDEEELA
jgi:hypothetical protein